MKIRIEFKPLTVNQAWKGKKYKTDEYKIYEQAVYTLIKAQRPKMVEGWVEVRYRFFLRHFKSTDVGNLEKTLTDIIVKAGLIDDDRFIKRMTLEKFELVDDKDHMEIEIISIKGEKTVMKGGVEFEQMIDKKWVHVGTSNKLRAGLPMRIYNPNRK